MEHQFLDINISANDMQNGIFDVVKALRPSWEKEQLDIKFLSGGFINKLYGVRLKTEPAGDDGLVVRVNSETTTGIGADRDVELRVLLALNQRDLSVPVLASFRNGLVFKFLKGRPLDDEQMRARHIMRLIAVELAKMHAMLPLKTDPRSNPLFLTRVSFDNIPKTLKDPAKQSRYSANIPYAEFASETLEIHQFLQKQNMEVAVGHGDLWQGNIMYDQEADSLTFIDYEQSGIHFAAWDIALYLLTTAGAPPDYNLHYPTDDDKKYFIRHYMEEKVKHLDTGNRDTQTLDERMESLHEQVRKCELLALLHLVNQCLYCETVLTDFDFIGMATSAWNEYKLRKKKYIKLGKK